MNRIIVWSALISFAISEMNSTSLAETGNKKEVSIRCQQLEIQCEIENKTSRAIAYSFDRRSQDCPKIDGISNSGEILVDHPSYKIILPGETGRFSLAETVSEPIYKLIAEYLPSAGCKVSIPVVDVNDDALQNFPRSMWHPEGSSEEKIVGKIEFIIPRPKLSKENKSLEQRRGGEPSKP